MANVPLPKPSLPTALHPTQLPTVGAGAMMPAGGPIRPVVQPPKARPLSPATTTTVLPPASSGGVGAVSPVRPVLAPATSTPTVTPPKPTDTPAVSSAVAPPSAVPAEALRHDVLSPTPSRLSVAPPVPAPASMPTPPPIISPLPSSPRPSTPTVTAAPTSPAPVVQPSVRPPQNMTALSSIPANTVPNTPGASPPPPISPPPTPTTVEFAKPKASIFRFLPFIIGGLLIILVAVFGVMWFLNRNGNGASTSSTTSSGTTSGTGAGGTGGTSGATSGQQTVLQYWGLWEPSETMQQVLNDFQSANPRVSVQYVKQSHKDYRTRLQNALNSGNGPDVFRFHASWVPMLKTELAPLPSAVMSASEYQKTFYPVAATQLQVNGTPVGIPLMYEGLALFYNVDILNTAVVQPPKTWSELQESARKLTVMEGSTVKRAGIAMGNATNVEHFSDIIALLMLQNGADFTKPNSPETRDALLFYTKFAKDHLWEDSLPSSSVAFARGDVAMIFAPSWRAHEIKQMNPSLNFATTTVPQLGGEEKIAWANFWAEGVGSKGKHQKEAWALLKYLSSKEVQQKMYAEQAKTRSFGEIYSRIDAADTLATDKVTGSFVLDAPKATSWYLNSSTHDGGINDELIQYYANAVGSVLSGKGTDEVLQTLDSGVKQVLQKYGLTKAGTSGQST